MAVSWSSSSSLIDADDELIQRLSLYREVHWAFHGHITPFIGLYAAWLYVWTTYYGFSEYFEAAMIVLAILGLSQILVFLCCYWSVHVMAFMTCKKEKNPRLATVAKVIPTPNNGSSEIVKLMRDEDEIWLIFQKIKYVFDKDRKVFKGLEFTLEHSNKFYLNWKGHESDEELRSVRKKFDNNTVDMEIPKFKELFMERATAPFFVFQVFCVGLWCLDEYWYYSVFTLTMLIMFECTLVKQQMRNMEEIRKMGNKPYMIQVYRHRRWRPILSDELVAGDIVSIGRSINGSLVPCDLLLLRGPCIVDESMLTGESVPQMKEALENVDPEGYFRMETGSKLHVLFGGTKIVQHTPPAKSTMGLRAQDNGCVAYVLRTGFNTSQGKLLRTILFGVRRVTANNLETFGFIVFLLIFAIAAASYVWVKGTEDPDRNRYKLFLECTLILTSVVPPELPIELSLAVNTSLISLHKLAVYCTEPFRIPFAGKIEICCFDKTGTLTRDNFVVEGVAGISKNDNDEVTSIKEIPSESVLVLATCHSLVQLDDGLVGDPLEKATITAIDWNLTKGEAVIPAKKGGKFPGMKIMHRHHFSSALKRMSVIAGYQKPGTPSETIYIATVKGAPEALKPMFAKVPENYDEVYLRMARRGARVLAMGWKQLGDLSHQQVRNTSRDNIECDLDFAGFVIISCPLKSDSKSVIKELVNASHHVTMITGDSPLTACHVARELRFTRHKIMLILTENPEAPEGWEWESVNRDKKLPLTTAAGRISHWKDLVGNHDLCVTGDGLMNLYQKRLSLFNRLLPHVRVFARVSPKNKELVITSLKAQGYCTLMCGDGTNDVGALKHADVGVAILSNLPEKLEKKKKKEEKVEKVNEETTNNTKLEKMKMSGKVGKRMAVVADSRQEKLNKTQLQMQKMLKELEEAEQAQIIKLGDASIAAPFTAKQSSISCINHIIKQGRCTLVTTLQMFKILALNALILAYSQSVLYLEGVKFSDGQATLQGLLLAACFLFISRSKPLKTLSKQRPLPNIFNPYTIFTVLSQFAVHFGCLIYLVQETYIIEPKKEKFPDLEKEFEPNLLNSTVFLISMTLQVSTFAVNYRGRPFMESLREHTALLYSLICSGSFVVLLALGWIPSVSEQFGIIEFPDEFQRTLIGVLMLDFVMSFVFDRVCLFLFGEGKLRQPY